MSMHNHPSIDRKPVRVVPDCDHVAHMVYRDRWAWCRHCGRTWYLTRAPKTDPATSERPFLGWTPARPEARPSEEVSA